MAEASRIGSVPWSERLFLSAPLPPLVLGALLGLAVGATVLGIELVFGELRAFLRGEPTRVGAEEYRFSMVFVLLIGYLPAAYVTAVRGSRRTWEVLRPVLAMSPADFEAARAEAGRFPAARLRWAGVLGAVTALSVPIFVDVSFSAYQLGAGTYLTRSLHRLMLPVVGWLFGRNLYAVLMDSSRLARAGREHLEVDLLDLRGLAPFTRHGLRNALLAMGTFAILALLIADWGTRSGLPVVLSFAILLAVGMGVAGLLLPVRGAHAAIRDAKARELASCNEAIRARLAAAGSAASSASAAPGDSGPDLGEWIAWRGFVESVREWPFDSSTLLRFLLYLAIPLGSWLGGAMVERAVDAALS